MNTALNLISTLFSVTPPNLIFSIIIFGLAIVDIVYKKDLKNQIISVGVLGTFVGIFIGLQNFDPDSMKNSVHAILLGLKTAFATSILGMSVAIFLSVFQKIIDKNSEDNHNHNSFKLLDEINGKLSYIPKLDNSAIISKIDKLINKFSSQYENNNNLKAFESMVKLLTEIKNKQISQGSELQNILKNNFESLNKSMEEATKQLSKGATEEIIDALQKVITNFNDNLQTQFGDNFKELNKAVVNLVEWQDKYKNHVENLESRLDLSTQSIEKAQNSLQAISSNNENIMEVYNNLSDIISTYKNQTENLTENLKSYSNLGPKAEKLFTKMNSEFQDITKSFHTLTNTIVDGNSIQRNSFIEMNKKIISLINNNASHITEQFTGSLNQVTKSFESAYESLERQRYEINIISNHFRVMGEQIPNALRVSLDELNNALSVITTKFQQDYEEIMYRYKDNININQQTLQTDIQEPHHYG